MANRAPESLAANAAAYLAKNADTVESLTASAEEIKRQSDCLVEWAKNRGVVLPDNHAAGLEKIDQPSMEHDVFNRVSDRRVVKCTRPGAFGFINDKLHGRSRKATPLSYLRRLELMNEVFGDDLIFEGVAFGTPRYDCTDDKLPYIVISQSWIDAADERSPEPSDCEISVFMDSLGFIRLNGSNQYYREMDEIIVSDAKPLNFIKSHHGIIPIDLQISKINK
jgi:hypothetical protein